MVRRLLKAVLVVSVVVGLTGCSLPRGAAVQAEIVNERDSGMPTFEVVAVTRDAIDRLAGWPGGSGLPPHDWPTAHEGPAGSLIRPGDRIDVKIWDSQENSLLTAPGQRTAEIAGVEVETNGEIFLPYVEQVPVAGLTAAVARQRIQSRFGEISPSAQVQLDITNGRRHAVDAVGGVQNPGPYPMPARDYRILNLVADAGGIRDALRNPQVALQRGDRTFRVSAERLFSSSRYNIMLRPRDSVIVSDDPRSFVALGAAGSENVIPFPKDRITALEAVSLMGGLSDSRADPDGVVVLREYPRDALRADGSGPAQEDVVFTFDLTSADGLFAARNFAIRSRDTVLATESPVNSARTILDLVGTGIGLSSRVGNLTN